MNKDTRVCIEMYGVARVFPVRDLGEGPVTAPSIAERLYHTNSLLCCIVMEVKFELALKGRPNGRLVRVKSMERIVTISHILPANLLMHFDSLVTW